MGGGDDVSAIGEIGDDGGEGEECGDQEEGVSGHWEVVSTASLQGIAQSSAARHSDKHAQPHHMISLLSAVVRAG